MIKRLFIGLCAVVLVLACTPMVSHRLALVVYHLPWGWIPFLERTLPNVTFNWSGLGMGLLCSLLILGLLHLFLSWLAPQLHKKHAAPAQANPSSPTGWPWRRTLCLYGGIWILFGVVMGASGLWRHSQWLAAVEPLYSIRRSPYAELKIAEGRMGTALLETKGDWPETKKAFLREDTNLDGSGVSFWERFQVLHFPASSRTVTSVLIVPREEKYRKMTGFAIVTSSRSSGFEPITNLAAVIAYLEGTGPSPSITQ